MKTVLKLKDICKTYQSDDGKQTCALDNISLSVQKGEFIALVGPTGCGKTTLLNILANHEKPSSGNVEFTDDSISQKNIPCVFQHYTLFPWRKLLANVTFGLEMQGVPAKERKMTALRLLQKVGLEGFEDSYPHELSGGMRQRASIAQALAIEPTLLLMDEPFGALDDKTRNELQKMLINFWQETGLTIIFVTHNIDEAIALANRVIIFSESPGKIVEELKVDLPHPRNRLSSEFTEQFVKTRQILGCSF